MEIDVSKPQWSLNADGARISFLVPYVGDARRICDDFEDGKRYSIVIKEIKKKRSLSANALMWVLLGEMAEILQKLEPGVSPDELYRRYISHSSNYCIAEVWEDDLPRMQSTWASNGIGWIAQPVDVTESEEGMRKYIVRLFYGSSQYDSTQMARLIDAILQDAASIGIDTASESFKALMEQYPGGQYG